MRRLDLPAYWDGRAVTWEPWNTAPLFVCRITDGEYVSPNRARCPLCARYADHATTRGTVARRTGDHIGPALTLHVYRCPHCSHDQVWDGHQLWDLDPADYGPTGSWET